MKNKFKNLGKTVFLVEGTNQARLLSSLSKGGVAVFGVEKISINKMRFSVNLSDTRKFFAITNNLCYNVKTVDKKGLPKYIASAVKNIGLIIGLAVFLTVAVLSNRYIVAVDFEGDGAVYAEVLENYLFDNGVKKFTKVSDIDCDLLQDKMLADNDFLSFVSVSKRGARLKVYATLKDTPNGVIDDSVYNLCSSVNGVVKSLKVYRGTAMVKVGDTVSNGDLLISGEVTVRDITVSSNVYASVVIETEKYYDFQSEYDGFEDKALSLAKSECGLDGEYSVIKIQENGSFVYKVTVKYLVTLKAG